MTGLFFINQLNKKKIGKNVSEFYQVRKAGLF